MLRTGYSFRVAYGHLEDVLDRVATLGWSTAPISDRNNTFAFNRWTQAVNKKGLRCVYGVELAVSPDIHADRPVTDYWRFLALEDLRPLHDLIWTATEQAHVISPIKIAGKTYMPPPEPMLSYSQALGAEGVIKITGSRLLIQQVGQNGPNMAKTGNTLFCGMTPSLAKPLFMAARDMGLEFCAMSDNVYPTLEDHNAYMVALGGRAQEQVYPQHILSDQELRDACWFVPDQDFDRAVVNRTEILDRCVASLRKASIIVPNKEKTLRQMCLDGARAKGCDLSDPVYAERLERELRLIDEKKFEDYFFVVADFMQWAKRRMVVGPGRGSSSGSLVCYLLDITVADPIKFDLVFERFIDITRADYPDIDVDLSDDRREMVFDYLEDRYGKERVARLGTVAVFQSKSALKQAAMAIGVPQWMVDAASNSVIVRSKGDSRADYKVVDTFEITDAGKKLIAEYPDMRIAGEIEAHPQFRGQHAAGIVMTEGAVRDYVGVDAHNGVAMVDWQDAKDLDLLKVDILGLTQLSIFERCLRSLGIADTSGFLEQLPLDDPEALDILSQRKLAGIFQFQGGTTNQIVHQIDRITDFEDIVSITALCRPGPLGSGGTQSWINRKNGIEKAQAEHELIARFVDKTLGIVIYQEQIMKICREIGDMSWASVTALRKAMGKSLGMEYFDSYRDQWIPGAIAKGMRSDQAEKFWREMCTHGMYCLSGETELFNPHPNQARSVKIKLKQLYEQRDKKQRLHCFQGDTIRPTRVAEVFSTGKRETWLIEVDSGATIRSTMEHRFLCSDGRYRPLKDLKSSDVIMMMGDRIRGKPPKGIGRGGQNWWPKFKTGEPLLARQIKRLKRIYKKCQVCKAGPYQITHHINNDHDDHRWENLLPVCRKCHQLMHHGLYKPNSRGRPLKAVRIVSISEPKIEDTYDVAMPAPHHNYVANGFVVHNSFNRAHALAYALVTYYCCWLKAHHPLEFAAATLDAEKEPNKHIVMLRELKAEGIEYTAIDVEHSTDHWTIQSRGNEKFVLGPLTLIDGIGPAAVGNIMGLRAKHPGDWKDKLGKSLMEKLTDPKTAIDSLYPIAEAVHRRYPDLSAVPQPNIATKPTLIKDVYDKRKGRDAVVIGVLVRNHPLNENEPGRVARRGGKVLTGPVAALNFHLRDDTGDIFCKVNRFDFAELGPPLINGKAGESIYAIKGSVPDSFRMVWVKRVKYLGEVDGTWRTEICPEPKIEMRASWRDLSPAQKSEQLSSISA